MSNETQAPSTFLMSGSTGPFVEQAQKWLNEYGWKQQAEPLTVNGTYDAATESAVKDYQQQTELPETGMVDSRTWYNLSGGVKNPGWDAETRPVFDAELSVTDGPNPYDPSQTLKFVHVQITQGGQPWKTPGIPVTFNVNTSGGILPDSQVLTDQNGVATYSYAPDAFRGFVLINVSAEHNFTDGQMVTGKIKIPGTIV